MMDFSFKLPGNTERVVVRFAPNPNGPPTLGSARGIVVNSELARQYKGEFIIRFDDTDPKVKKPLPEAYGWYLEDCEWLGAKPDKVVTASDRLDRYYKVAEELVKQGNAYVCTCSQEEFKRKKDLKKACQHRDTEADANLAEWRKMLAGEYREKEAVLRIKTEVDHPDPALRDWVAFRILEAEHPRQEVGSKYTVWPTLDLESAIEDHDQGITHILRGKDLMDSGKRQKYVYDYLGWTYPEVVLWGRVKIEDYGRLSTSGMAEAIANGEYEGWDDPRLPTIRALKRRGITADAIRNFMLDLGIGENDISLSTENLYAENRKILDPIADRYFFIPDPLEFIVEGAVNGEAKLPLNPSHREKGYRTLEYTAGKPVYLAREDIGSLEEGDEVRLMNLFNFKTATEPMRGVYAPGKNLKVKKIQWLQDYVNATVVMPDNTRVSGYCEPACKELDEGAIIQFERFGFARLDSKKDGELVFYYTHR